MHCCVSICLGICVYVVSEMQSIQGDKYKYTTKYATVADHILVAMEWYKERKDNVIAHINAVKPLEFRQLAIKNS